MASPPLYLARHGRTAYNHERRFQGRLPVALDEVGRQQALELAARARELSPAVIWSSPLRRARETAEIVAEQLGLELREDERLMETDAGSWTDMTFAEVQARWPEQFARFARLDPDFAFPDGESFAQQQKRVVDGLAQIAGGPAPALVVCHGVVIRLALRAFHQEPPQRIENGALIEVVVPCAQRSTPAAGR